MKRRDFLAGSCWCLLSAAANGFSFGMDTGSGLRNPCRAPLPDALLNHDITQAAFSGLNAADHTRSPCSRGAPTGLRDRRNPCPQYRR